MTSSNEQAVVENVTELFKSGKFSDLVLRCGGYDFHVHRSIVCLRSPVLAAASEGGFEEATTRIIDVTITNKETLRLLLTYLYTGDYDAKVSSPLSKQTAAAGKNDDLEQVEEKSISEAQVSKIENLSLIAGGSKDPANQDQEPSNTDFDDANLKTQTVDKTNSVLIANTLVYIAADYYQILDLKEAAVSKFRDALTNFSPEGFAEVCVLLYDSNTSIASDLRSSLCSAIVNNSQQLLADEDFLDTVAQLPKFTRELFPAFMIHCESALKAKQSAEKAIAVVQTSEKRALQEAKEAKEHKENAVKMVNNRKSKSCGHCGAKSTLYFEHNWPMSHISLRCVCHTML